MSDVPTTETPTSATPAQTTPTSAEQTAEVVAQTTAPEVSETKSLLGEPDVLPFDAEKLTLPEGFEKTEHFDQFVEWSKEAGISQSQAEKLINLYSEATKHGQTSLHEAWEKQNMDWQTEVKGDKELGGANLPHVKQTISKVLDNPELADPKFREALDYTGAGNNPAVIRTLFRICSKLSEGASITGGAPGRGPNGELANAPRSVAQAIYGPNGPHTGGPNRG